MKAEQYINQESFVVVNPDYPVISKENALKAVEMAREEIKEKALEAVKNTILQAYTAFSDEEILDEFKKELEEKK